MEDRATVNFKVFEHDVEINQEDADPNIFPGLKPKRGEKYIYSSLEQDGNSHELFMTLTVSEKTQKMRLSLNTAEMFSFLLSSDCDRCVVDPKYVADTSLPD